MTTHAETAARETNSTLHAMDVGELNEHLSSYLENYGWTLYAEAVFERLVTLYTDSCSRPRFECSIILRTDLAIFADGDVGVRRGLVADLADGFS